MNQEDVESTAAMIVDVLTTYGLNVIGAILVLVVGWIASKWVSMRSMAYLRQLL